jgi:hypothetical protein
LKDGLSGSTLKLIAVTSMLIDHAFAALVEKVYINKALYMPGLVLPDGAINYNLWIFGLQNIMRGTIGRIAFPIFCFLLVQGFIHTSNRNKYKLRLLVFALISELPFNLALKDSFTFRASNVFFTLLLGLLSMELIEKDWSVWLRGLGVAAIAFFAEIIKCDYGASGVILIAFLYLAKDDMTKTVLVGFVSMLTFPSISPMSILAYIPIIFYNGKRGLKLKYAFYLFYPAHLLVLYLARQVMLQA